MRIGVLTGGGDCPGLNAVIRAVVRKGVTEYGHEFVGFRDGWKGPLEGADHARSTSRRSAASCRAAARSSARRGPTPSKIEGGVDADRGEPRRRSASTRSSPSAARTPSGSRPGSTSTAFKVVGVPKTIDNDLNATDYTFGFDTAVDIATEAIDRLHTTAESHHRVLVVEVMGRHAGWIALHSGLAGGANIILIPEVPFDIDEVCGWVEHRFQTNYAPIIVRRRGRAAARTAT